MLGFLRFALFSVVFLGPRVQAAVPTTVATDPNGISGFDLFSYESGGSGGSDVVASFSVTGLHWWRVPRCLGDFRFQGTVRLRASPLSATHGLANQCTVLEDNPYANVVRDEAYIYLFSNGYLQRKPVNFPSEVDGFELLYPNPLLTDERGTVLEMANGYLYWGQYRADVNWVDINRMKPEPGQRPEAPVLIPDAGASVRKIKAFSYVNSSGVTVDAIAVLLTNGKLYRCKVAARTTILVATGINDFAIHTRSGAIGFATSIYASKGIDNNTRVPLGSPPGTLLKIDADTLGTSTILTASGINQIISVATDSDQFVPFGGGSFARKNVYVTETEVDPATGNVIDFLIRRHSVSTTSGLWDYIVATDGGGNLRSDDRFLYFFDYFLEASLGGAIKRISTGALPVELDLQADALEVVQTSQDANNSVRLIANKPTFVRGYAHLAPNTTGRPFFFARAKLEGFLNGASLGPPINALNSAAITEKSELQSPRANAENSFLFKLPASWVQPGSLTLTMSINTDGVVPETGAAPTANNSVSLPAPLPITKKDRATLVLVPMATDAPFYNLTALESHISDILERARSMLPVEDFSLWARPEPVWKPVFHGCWDIPPVCVDLRPFNLPDDKNWALFWLTMRNLLSKWQPPGRDVHWVGTVDHGIGGRWTGIGGARDVNLRDLVDSLPPIPIPNTPIINSSVVRMNPTANYFGAIAPDWNSPRGGVTLAHELGHNYGRFHIDQSGFCDPENRPARPYHPYSDSFGSYNPCTLGPTDGPRAIFGFDPIRQLVILPTDAGDLMTYARTTWTSKINWDAIFAQIPGSPTFGAAAIGAADFGAPPAPGGRVLLVHGFINPAENRAGFWPFYQLSEDDVDTGKLAQSLGAVAQMPAENPFKLRLLDAAGNQLPDVPLLVANPADDDHTHLGFVQFLRFDPTIRQIQLINGNTILSERLVSDHPPMLALTAPVLDPTNQTLALTWNANDADNDPLLFTVQYSCDDGATWIALQVDYPWLAVTLDARRLPGGELARLRVIATDGVNSTQAMTEPFLLARHAPELQISGVREWQRLRFGEPAQLRGLALDAEEGSLPGESLFWSLSGPTPLLGSGSTLGLADLSPGLYRATLSAADSHNQTAILESHLEMMPPAIPDVAGPAPVLDGYCADAGYANATLVRIPLGPGEYTSARLFHSGSNLFVCFTELNLPSGLESRRTIGLRVDANASRDPSATPADIGFFVDSEGIPFQEIGTGMGMAETYSPQRGFTAVVQKGANGWSAEFRIADSLVGGWDHAIGLMLAHGASPWPVTALAGQPMTWAPAYLGTTPPPGPNRAPIARVGQNQNVNVAVDTTVYLNGADSFDPDGDGLTYSWIQVSGPPMILIEAGTATPRFFAKPPAATTPLRFRLFVSDGVFNSAPEDMEVTLWHTPSQALAARLPASQARVVGEAFQLRLRGEPGVPYSIDASSNLVHWQTLHAATADFNGTLGFMDRDMTNHPVRFYRTTPAPTNDHFANHTPLTGAAVSVSTANFLATEEPGEPDHFGNAAGKSLWWSWTAPGDGYVTLSTVGSDFDTLLAVYIGNPISQLGLVTADDDSGGNGASRVTFNAQVGVTYQIAVDGYDGASGNIQLNLTQVTPEPPNDNFPNRIPLNGASLTILTASFVATEEPGEPDHAGNPGGKSLWWSWTAPGNGAVTISTIGSDFDTLLAVYLGNSIFQLGLVAADDDGGGTFASGVVFNAVAGVSYQIAVDGFDGTSGNIQLNITMP